jgi:riboflavin synthase
VFTGLVQAVGRLVARTPQGDGARLEIDAAGLDLGDVQEGDSIAVAGVCLTALAPGGQRFGAHASAETLARTTLGALPLGTALNLEKSLRLADRLGGHLVSGHVDGIGSVRAIVDDGAAQRWTFAAPAVLMRYIAAKGSICIDGTSLTVNTVGDDAFGVTLIPHTLTATTFGERRAGDAVNLEVDLVARYVERLASAAALPPLP